MEPHYLDSNVFFYAKIRDRKYGDACAEIPGEPVRLRPCSRNEEDGAPDDLVSR